MVAASSQESFLGPYLNDELREPRRGYSVTKFVSCAFRFVFEPFALAIQAKDRIEEKIHKIVPLARAVQRVTLRAVWMYTGVWRFKPAKET
jgi:hypothetical protein